MKKTLAHLICMAALGVSAAAHAQNTEKPVQTKEGYDLPAQPLTAGIMFTQLVSDISLQRGKFQDAYKGYMQLAVGTKDPRYAERAYMIASALGESEAARRSASLLVQLAPNAKISKEFLAASAFENIKKYYKEGNYQALYDGLKEVLAVNPDEPTALMMMGDVADGLGKFSEARAALTKLVKNSPKDPEALNALGYLLAKNNVDLAQARTYIEHAHDLNPEAPHIIDSLAWLAYRQNRLDEAVEWANQIADSKQAEIQTHRGEILWAAKKRDEAIAAFQKAYQINPKDKTLASTLTRLAVDIEAVQTSVPPKP